MRVSYPCAITAASRSWRGCAQRPHRTLTDRKPRPLLVLRAFPGGQRAVLNGEEAWLYTFAPEDLSIPAIRLGDDGRMTVSGGELWIAPARSAVVRFYVNLDVENAVIFDRQLPVTGRVLLRYDVYEIGEAYNITIPFGC